MQKLKRGYAAGMAAGLALTFAIEVSGAAAAVPVRPTNHSGSSTQTTATTTTTTATLRLNGRLSMEDLAESVMNPKSSRYRRFYSPAEIRALAAPTDADYDRLLLHLKNSGLRVRSQSATHLWLQVEGDPQVIAHLTDRPRFFLASETGGEAATVGAVIGLDHTTHMRSQTVSLGTTSQVTAGLRQESMKSAYGFDSLYRKGFSGRGQTIAIATFGNLKLSDVRQFYATSGLDPVPQVDTVQFNGVAAYDESPASETELDTEFAGLIAPGASIHVFTSASNDDDGEAQLFTAILDDNRAKIVSYSWGSCEGDSSDEHYREMNGVFARAVAQGVNVLVAAGDHGSACGDDHLHAEWPSTSPYVVSIGGTSFRQDNSGSLNETAWACWTGIIHCGGGGISQMFARPSWQVGIPNYAGRAYPDVSFNADPATGEAMFFSGVAGSVWRVVGGTSMATPHWAGLLALLGEARLRAGKGPIGFLNPALYSQSNSSNFNDITVGTNGAYNCTPGWDPVTGFGSPRAFNFVESFTRLF